ncbi:polysaccharide deacetylase family protein [Chryseobacterium sp. WG23]|uniref:polysaccharide deacetylase family protein n=1 Tax=Chryseobacterium sp. WG23 TaxID=2926910 RepID=UPI00211E1D1B|nr:polysaccharide deacetylase family protein [Chryseobacterium sp. WG23]MCQ9633500.1 polysaccharide deacetylase family protein [Chryseobacterium sp. WG23]
MNYIRQSAWLLFSTVFLVSCFSNDDRTQGENSNPKETQVKGKRYWPNGAQLVISISMQFETGGQPEGAESPFSGTPLPTGQPDLPAESWYRYGGNEGIYRMLDLWKKYNIKVTSHMVGTAAEKYPEVAKAIANGGHEVAAHGFTWDNQWNKSFTDELYFVKEGVDVVEKITGKRAVGYNSNWLRRSPNTLKVLQELGFLYHIDDVSHDEPFITKVKGKNFMVIPYTIRNNDIVNIEGKHWSPDQFLAQLKFEFDRLYEEGASKRRMMSISFHDRIGGTPAMIHAMEEFIKYTQKKQGVVFMRKDDIAKMVMNDPRTPVDNSEEKYNK